MIDIKFDPIEKDVAVLFPGTFTPQQRSKELADFARVEIKKADDHNFAATGARVPYDVYVDGRQAAPLTSVKPTGVIVAEWNLVLDMFKWIDEQLAIHSPVGSALDKRPGHPGLYRRSHVLFADNIEVLANEAPPPAHEYFFVNMQPYARKIERGHSAQAPNGVYETVAVLANQRFSKFAKIRFSYRSPLAGDIQAWASSTRMKARASANRRNEWLTRQPAIVITPR
jgi:hypothetical protein